MDNVATTVSANDTSSVEPSATPENAGGASTVTVSQNAGVPPVLTSSPAAVSALPNIPSPGTSAFSLGIAQRAATAATVPASQNAVVPQTLTSPATGPSLHSNSGIRPVATPNGGNTPLMSNSILRMFPPAVPTGAYNPAVAPTNVNPPPSTAMAAAQPGTSTRKRKPASAAALMRRKRIRPTIIDDKIAIKIFKELRLTRVFLQAGNLLAWTLQPDDPAFAHIHDYVARGQEHGYGIKIMTILRVIPRADTLKEDIVEFNNDPKTAGKHRMMLWHGSPRRFLPEILKSGLKLPKARKQMFGPGIYFADRVSKSANYCDNANYGNPKPGGEGYLFLCDVLLGNPYNCSQPMPKLKGQPISFVQGKGLVSYDSLKGVGKKIPDPKGNKTMDGTVWPMGLTINSRLANLTLQFNEYVVYNESQVQPKYLIKFEFVAAPLKEKIY